MTRVQLFINNYNRLAPFFADWLSEDMRYVMSTRLSDAATYSLMAGGKRLRPALVMATAEMLRVALENVRGFALAVEYIHTSSLIHDDLPAMDDDSMRRGQPACHVKYGEAAAILTGDFLIARAFQALAGDVLQQPDVCKKLVTLLSGAVVALCEGQILDLDAAAASRVDDGGGGLGEESALELRRRHLMKTGALIRACVVGPAEFLSGSKSEGVKYALSDYGNCLGLLFQITDDILDATSTTEVLGKSAKNDSKQGALTYVSLFGVDAAKKLAQETADQALDALSLFGEDAWFHRALCLKVLERDK